MQVLLIFVLLFTFNLSAEVLSKDTKESFQIVSKKTKVQDKILIKLGYNETRLNEYSALINADTAKNRKNGYLVKRFLDIYKINYMDDEGLVFARTKNNRKKLKSFKLNYSVITYKKRKYYRIKKTSKNLAMVKKLKMKYFIKAPKYFSIRIKEKARGQYFYTYFKAFLKVYPHAVKTYDLGIMQINEQMIKTYKVDEYKYYINPSLNILLGSLIFKECKKVFKNSFKDTIECYNKGTKKSRFIAADYDYYEKYSKINYKKLI